MAVVVLAISVDSVFVHKEWQEIELTKLVEGGAFFPLVSDPGGKIGKLYEAYDENEGGLNRATFIIDPDGIVRAMEVLSSSVGRNIEETLRQLHAFQAVRESRGREVCPAGWKPGEETLRPSHELVGHIWEVWHPREGR